MVIIMIIDHGNGKIGDGFDYYVYCDGDDDDDDDDRLRAENKL